MKQDQYNFTC